ncbi:MAG: hypothetical protein EAZ24_11960 [Burkholderiales bacterium]|nr:MAG: hypothetical protein EAZ24_11960 [Burkholderiales bacterium]TAG78719.1 MAG: hypothetical protein EAZ21_12085 [Betaproteobacteria bacterium]
MHLASNFAAFTTRARCFVLCATALSLVLVCSNASATSGPFDTPGTALMLDALIRSGYTIGFTRSALTATYRIATTDALII